MIKQKQKTKKTNKNFILFSDYATFADIYIASNGFRRLVLHGHRFGERGSNANRSVGIHCWQCTANMRDKVTGKMRRCTIRLKTKVIDGYEMIQNIDVKHKHKPIEYR